MEQDISRFLDRFKISQCNELALAISPIVHPRRWDRDHPELTRIWLEPGVHPLLASVLAPRVPQIHLETAISCLRYLQSGGHSIKSRKSLKPLLKSSHFTRLKMRSSLSHLRKRRRHHSGGRYFLDWEDLHSTWWGNQRQRPMDYIEWLDKFGVRVPLRFFSYRSQYTSNYDLWYTYRYALQLLPIVLAKSPPDSHLAYMAADCVFNSFCTAYPQETRKAKKSITNYLSRCRPIRAMPSRKIVVVDDRDGMDVN